MTRETESPEREARILAAFEQALEAGGSIAALDAACGNDTELRRRVEALLVVAREDPALEPPDLVPHLASFVDRESERLAAGERVGAYRIARLIGEGSTGDVYEAVQDLPKRTVALKVIRSAYVAPSVLKRFDYETEALARLQHAGIAQIFEAGVASSARGPRPFFAMEFIEGRHLDDYARGCTREERLRLFANVCEAVLHAHQRGIVHRDLKPANILVGDDGQPKVLDFGIARAIEADASETAAALDDRQILGTLAYMSPEQAEGGVDRLDARSDVYSLGVLLYELLADRLPVEVPERFNLSALRFMAEADPTPIRSIDPSLRGDLEAIVGKALAKDQDERYPSASALADDVRRFLEGHPVEARSPTLGYQLGKLVRRHRKSAAAITALVLGLCVALALSLHFMRSEADQRRVADLRRERAVDAEREMELALAEVNAALAKAFDEEAKAREVSTFFSELLRAVQPHRQGRDVTVVDLLHAAGEKIAAELPNRPQVRATLHLAVGVAFRGLSELEAAEPHLLAAHALREEHVGAADLATVEALEELAVLRFHQGRLDEAETTLRRSAAGHEAVLGDAHRRTLRSWGNLALTLAEREKLEEAERLVQRMLGKQREIFAPDDDDILVAIDTLGQIAYRRERYATAEEHFREGLALSIERYGERAAKTVTAQTNLMTALLRGGELDEAEELSEKILEGSKREYGPYHRETFVAQANHAELLFRRGRASEADRRLRELIETMTARVGADNIDTLNTRHTRCALLIRMRRFHEAEGELLDVFEEQMRVLGPHHSDTRLTLEDLGWCLYGQNKLEEALAYLRDLRALLDRPGDERARRRIDERLTTWEAQQGEAQQGG